MPLYALRVSLDHTSFRIPSLLSISQLYGFPIKFVSEDVSRGILVVDMEKDEDVQHLLDRGTLILWAAHLFASGTSYDELHKELKSKLSLFDEDMHKTFKITVDAVNNHIPGPRQMELPNSFSYLNLKGGADLKKPEVEYLVFEDYDYVTLSTRDARYERDGNFRFVYFAKMMGVSRARPLVKLHQVKERAFYGNTSMDAEMGLLMATQAMPSSGKIIYDPFAGTGSMLYGCAHWGAYVWGSDIDSRQMRGKAKGKGVVPGMFRTAQQYGIADRFIDCMTFDVTRGPWRQGGWVDAIVTDPPYGVRAGAKRLGKRDSKKHPWRDEPYICPDGTVAHTKPDYLPPFRPYDLVTLTYDLIVLARWLLRPKGRLVFMLPTVTEEYDAIDIPQVEGMRELKWGEGSVQDFGRWGRRLITMEKTATDDGPQPHFGEHNLELQRTPGHHDFAKHYFKRFPTKKEPEEAAAAGFTAGEGALPDRTEADTHAVAT